MDTCFDDCGGASLISDHRGESSIGPNGTSNPSNDAESNDKTNDVKPRDPANGTDSITRKSTD